MKLFGWLCFVRNWLSTTELNSEVKAVPVRDGTGTFGGKCARLVGFESLRVIFPAACGVSSALAEAKKIAPILIPRPSGRGSSFGLISEGISFELSFLLKILNFVGRDDPFKPLSI